jgi:hypothetical protein
MKHSVLQHRAQHAARSYRIELVDRPAWMPDALAGDIARALRPAEQPFADPTLCRTIHDRAEAHPWVASVRQVRRISRRRDSLVRVTANFRQPVARVQQDTRVWFVDAAGVVLPYHQTPRFAAAFERNGRTAWRTFSRREDIPIGVEAQLLHYIVIQGVAAAPPQPGRPWPGDDLAAALRLVKLVRPQPWSNQITVADVRNHAKRISHTEPEYRLYAYLQVPGEDGRLTDIRFGRFPHPDGGDCVISPRRKVEYLDRYVAGHGGRLAGLHEYIDLRYDQLRTSVN